MLQMDNIITNDIRGTAKLGLGELKSWFRMRTLLCIITCIYAV